MVKNVSELRRLGHLRKVVFGGAGPLQWRSFSLRRSMSTQLFSVIPSLEWVSFGLELWQRGQGDNVVLDSYPDEWKDRCWWE